MQTHFSEEAKKHMLAGVVIFQAIIIMVLAFVNATPLVQIQGGHIDNKPIDMYGWTGALVPSPTTSDIQELDYLQTIAKNSQGNINTGLWEKGTPDTYYLTAKHGSGLINDFVVKSNQKYLGVHVLDATYGNWYPGIGTPSYDVIVFQTH